MRIVDAALDWVHLARTWPRSFLDRTSTDALESGDRTPVVLLPGIWETWRYLLPLARALHRAGHPVHPVPALRLNGAPLDASTDVVAEALAQHPSTRVVRVAHSKGGLIGKRLMLHPGVSGRIEGLVALCSPFGGSKLALPILSRTPLGLFSPANAALMALAAEREVNARIVSIGASWDEMVPNGTHVDGARNITLPVSGHFRPLAMASVHELVISEIESLTQPRTRAPGTA